MSSIQENAAAVGAVRRERIIDGDALERALSLRDLTDPGAGPHAMQLILRDVRNALEHAWSPHVIVDRAHPVVNVADCYDRLHYPPDAAAREARHTRYVEPQRVLRTHTTAMIPPLLERLAAMQQAPRDVLLMCPGLVYRRDTIDRLHVGEPHQCDVWRIRRGRALGPADLREMIVRVLGAALPDAPWRALPRTHPYTQHGLQVDVHVGSEWVEVLECGVALPDLLAEAGLDPRTWSGLAMGIGLDRLLMLRKGIDDIRLLRADDPRIAGQMLDLSPWRPVSSQPPIRRDLSVAVEADTSPEEIGDRVRAALADDVEWLESVEILSETPADELPDNARARIGLRAGQKNVLLSVVLRHPARSLTRMEANRLRDRVYAAVHEGSAWTWASS